MSEIDRISAELKQVCKEFNKLSEQHEALKGKVGLSWPPDARFQPGDRVHVIRKRERQPRFPGYVVGWYKPLNGDKMSWVLEHERDGIIHVYPDGAVMPGIEKMP